MKKLFVISVLALLMALPIVAARSVPAYGYWYQPAVNKKYDRYQIVRVASNSFTRAINGDRHILSLQKIDQKTRTLTFDDRVKGKKQTVQATYDANNLGNLVILGASFPFQVNAKY